MIYQLDICRLLYCVISKKNTWAYEVSYDITTHRAKVVEASFLYFYIHKLMLNYLASINLGKLVNQ